MNAKKASGLSKTVSRRRAKFIIDAAKGRDKGKRLALDYCLWIVKESLKGRVLPDFEDDDGIDFEVKLAVREFMTKSLAIEFAYQQFIESETNADVAIAKVFVEETVRLVEIQEKKLRDDRSKHMMKKGGLQE